MSNCAWTPRRAKYKYRFRSCENHVEELRGLEPLFGRVTHTIQSDRHRGAPGGRRASAAAVHC